MKNIKKNKDYTEEGFNKTDLQIELTTLYNEITTSSEVKEDIETLRDRYNNSTEKIDFLFKKVLKEDIDFLKYGFKCSVLCISIVILIWWIFRKFHRKTHSYLCFVHNVTSFLHFFLLFVFYFTNIDGMHEFYNLLLESKRYLTLTILLWTLNFSIFAFSKLILSDGEDMYSRKDLTAFCYDAAAVIEVLEEFVSSMFSETTSEKSRDEVLRLTSYCLIEAVPITIFFILIVCFFSKRITMNRNDARNFIIYLLIFIVSDFFLILFRCAIVNTTLNFKIVVPLFCCRPIIEFVLFVYDSCTYYSLEKLDD